MSHLVVKSVSLEFNFSTKYLPKVTESSSWRFGVTGVNRSLQGVNFTVKIISLIVFCGLINFVQRLKDLSRTQ